MNRAWRKEREAPKRVSRGHKKRPTGFEFKKRGKGEKKSDVTVELRGDQTQQIRFPMQEKQRGGEMKRGGG